MFCVTYFVASCQEIVIPRTYCPWKERTMLRKSIFRLSVILFISIVQTVRRRHTQDQSRDLYAYWIMRRMEFRFLLTIMDIPVLDLRARFRARDEM